VASIRHALEFQDPDEISPDTQLAVKFATSGKAVLEDVVRINSAPADPLRGGDEGREWSQKIMDGVARDLERARDNTLAKYGYDRDKYAYAGITAPDNEDLITTVVRLPLGDTDLHRSEALTASGWRPVDFDFHGEDRETFGIGLDPELLAFTASALIEDGMSGVLLAYDEPICFLPDHPLLAAAPSPANNSQGNVYAIVDSTDTSAVMDVIMVTPGDKHALVYRRNGGAWKLEPTLYEAFMSITPPPIVELTGSQRDQLIAQVDATAANQIQTIGNGQAQLGDKPVQIGKPGANKQAKGEKDPQKDPAQKLKPKAAPGTPAPPEGREKRTPEDAEEGPNSRPPIAAALAQRFEQELSDTATTRQERRRAALAYYYSDEGYAAGYSLTAALQTIDADTARAQLDVRQTYVNTVMAEMEKTRARIRAQEQVILPAVTASSGTAPGKPGQQSAEQLRQYWVHGAGAVKIRWGTPGDWRRCTRQLKKYLGERAKGYCQLRHREATGVYTGDKANK
jgi:hypothetical protein